MTAITTEAPVAPVAPPVIPDAFSRTFRSGRTRSRVAIASLVVIALIYGVWAWSETTGLALVDRAELGLVTDAELLEYDSRALAIAGAFLLASIVCAIAFLAWLSRTVDNIPVLTGRVPKTTPRWSIGWWFIPFANFVKPYLVVKEASTHLAGPTGRPSTGLILIWWVTFIVGSIVSNVVSRMPVLDADDFRTFLTVGLVVDVLEIGAAILAIVVVLRIQSSADTLAASAPAALAAAQLPATDVAACPRCGAVREAGIQFCGHCGLDLWAAYDQQHP